MVLRLSTEILEDALLPVPLHLVPVLPSIESVSSPGPRPPPLAAPRRRTSITPWRIG